MHVELVVPGLLAAAQGARLPCAELLLARGRASRAERVSVERWLQEAFGLEGDGLPAGALTALARGEAAEGYFARADPTHLRLMRESIAVVPGAALTVSREEADALAAAINDHFAGRLEVHVSDPVRWWARLAEPLELRKEPALEHAGRALRPGTTGGASAESLSTEIQMLLHAHSVNDAREARGEPPLNSLWLWGGGAAPKDVQSPWQSVTADDPVALGLAQAAKSRGRALPASADAWLARLPEDGRHLLLLDGLRPPGALEQAWFAPLLGALRGGRIGMLTVHVPDSGVSFETIRGDLRRFWRRRRPLTSYQE